MKPELRQAALRISHTVERMAAELPPLLLESSRVAAQFQHGLHGRRRTGQGESFWQFRRYQPGDDAGAIDWRSSARSQHVFVREREWEVAQTLMLWVDCTGSMDWRSDKHYPTKLVRALVLALALARLALDAGEQVATLQQPERRYRGKDALDELALAILLSPIAANPENRPIPRYARLLIISDFLDPVQPWRALCSQWAQQGCDGHLLQVLDPAEAEPPWRGRLLLEGCEGEAPMLVPRLEDWTDAYRNRLAARQAELRILAGAMGWGCALHRTDQSPQICLDRLYQYFSTMDHAALRQPA